MSLLHTAKTGMPNVHDGGTLRTGGRMRRKGTILVLSAFLMIVMFAMLAFSIDMGYMMTVQTEIQRSVDSAALASVGMLAQGEDHAQAKAVEFLVRNPVGSQTAVDEEQLQSQIAAFIQQHQDDYEINIGHWDPDALDQTTGKQGAIVPADGSPSAVSVFYEYKNQPLFFAPLLGREHFDVKAQSVAVYQPRDISLVLDLSGSMNDDTEFQAISTLGQAHVESNLLQCYHDLGSPVYGTLEFQPRYAVVPGQPPGHPSQPQIHVEYRHKEVYITSSKDLSNVVLEYSNGNTQKFDGLSGHAGTFKGSGSNNNKWIKKVWVKSGNNGSGEGPGYGEPFDFSTGSKQREMIRKAFDLDSVPYPYPSGSWNSYINYARKHNGQNAGAGYRYQFGYMNLITYWLEKKYRHDQTPDLWKCSAQPITAVKNSVGVFMEYIQQVDTDDQVAMSVYNAPDGDGKIEQHLTVDLDSIAALAEIFQAGHYHNYTNIGAGLTKAREELLNNGRPGAFKFIVLLTDGKANWVDGGYDQSAAHYYVLDEAQLCKESKLPVVTISLGTGADTHLMQEVADITGGIHFNIPGGQSVADYHQDLLDVFRTIADDRPLKIVR